MADPWAHELTALQQIDVDANAWSYQVVANLQTLGTQATLGGIKVKTDNLDVALSSRASEATLAALLGRFPSVRNITHYFTAAGVAATNVEAMQSLTGYKGGVGVAPTATPAVVTALTTYRVTAIELAYQSLVTAGGAEIRLRANLAGVGVVGSPLVGAYRIGSRNTIAGVTTTRTIEFPDGLEFPAGTGIAIGVLGLDAVGAAAAAGFVSVALHGYEY